ncbi:MAG: peptide deformylase [Bacteroidota bacterium]
MIYPIVAYGDPVLRKKAARIKEDYPKLEDIIDNMFATMYHSQGVGLAAPQVGLSIRLFVIDATPFKADDKNADGFKRVFINAEMLEEYGDPWKFNEGCLSIPGVREDITRKDTIYLRYMDENFDEYEEEFDGWIARVIQHEYDHTEGILFTDKVTALKKRLLKGRLTDISKGIVDCDYKMRFYKK